MRLSKPTSTLFSPSDVANLRMRRDVNTNRVIQRLIQSHFQAAAVMIIAHRLEDIIACHRVVVMNAGVVLEMGTPAQLLKDKKSMLAQLARNLGNGSEPRVIAE